MGLATARSTLTVLAFEDDLRTRNPKKRSVQREHDIGPVVVRNPGSDAYDVGVGATTTAFNTAEALTADAGTTYSLAAVVVPGEPPGTYRLQWTGTGAAPGFRTPRGVALAGRTATLTVNSDTTVTVTLDSTTPFGAVVAGDVALIPGVATGAAAGPFNGLNEGFWTVLQATTSSVVLVRRAGDVYSALGESAVVAADTDLRFFSAAGVQIGDTVEISAGFPTSAQHAYPVVGVAADYVDLTSPTPLPQGTAVPGVSGVQAYRAARAYVLVESDQEVGVVVNSTAALRLVPVAPGDPDNTARFEVTGPVYRLDVTNRSQTPAAIRVTSWQ